jgi:5-hydroxyisourate hydrolase
MKLVAQTLDGTYGKSAVGLRAHLSRADGDGWVTVAEAETSSDGRIDDWDIWHLGRGVYQILFESDSYFAGLGSVAAYPEVVVIFRVRNDDETFHVQLTLSPYSYSIYFGSMESQPVS